MKNKKTLKQELETEHIRIICQLFYQDSILITLGNNPIATHLYTFIHNIIEDELSPNLFI